MALRFRKSVKLAPGIRMNFSGGGVSWSLGPRGASIGIGKRGTYLNAGIPGTGLSFRERLGPGATGGRRAPATSSSGKVSMSVTVGVEDDGTMIFKDEAGYPLSSELVAVAKRQQGDSLRNLMQSKCDEINAQVGALRMLHHFAPRPTDHPAYQPSPFDDPRPSPPQRKTPGFLKKLFGGADSVEKENARAEGAYRAALQDWEQAKEEHENAERRKSILMSQAAAGKVTFMEIFLEQALQDIVWPRETLVSFEIQDGGARLVFDVDLPEIEDMPTKVAGVPQRGYKLSVKELSQTKVQQLYAEHVHSITFRLIAEAFALLPTLSEVILSGFTQRADPSTGHETDQYLLSVRVRREEWVQINFDALESVDVVEALGRFENRRLMTRTGAFRAIEPF
ncbi:DUF4236 domain-containing protein [Thauera mechernichensis]|uniref:DUF4236 domain-containing protein n=1 Tax=Thauera mechernichensis TaxID=82788 RepID=A0ABW3WJJ4_9RHOO|nr:DUF4236 domain-containing protein [Thauera mechernichensis]MDG3066067.1 DUF4236 domain-containing protein [Thauera mechernichensis]